MILGQLRPNTYVNKRQSIHCNRHLIPFQLELTDYKMCITLVIILRSHRTTGVVFDVAATVLQWTSLQ